MKSLNVEILEEMTHVIECQATIIRKLYGLVIQHNAVSEMDFEIESLQKRAACFMGSME